MTNQFTSINGGTVIRLVEAARCARFCLAILAGTVGLSGLFQIINVAVAVREDDAAGATFRTLLVVACVVSAGYFIKERREIGATLDEFEAEATK